MRKCVFSETDSCLNDSKLFFERENEKKRKEEKGKIGRKKWKEEMVLFLLLRDSHYFLFRFV